MVNVADVLVVELTKKLMVAIGALVEYGTYPKDLA